MIIQQICTRKGIGVCLDMNINNLPLLFRSAFFKCIDDDDDESLYVNNKNG